MLLIAHGCRRNNGQLQPRENVGLVGHPHVFLTRAASFFFFLDSFFFCYFSIFPLVKIVEVLFFALAAFMRRRHTLWRRPSRPFFKCPTGFQVFFFFSFLFVLRVLLLDVSSRSSSSSWKSIPHPSLGVFRCKEVKSVQRGTKEGRRARFRGCCERERPDWPSLHYTHVCCLVRTYVRR